MMLRGRMNFSSYLLNTCTCSKQVPKERTELLAEDRCLLRLGQSFMSEI